MPRIVPSVWLTAIQGTAASRVLDFLRSIHALPAAYLASIEVYLIKSTLGHQAYLLGQVSASGWWYYYVVAFLAKNTPGFLLAVAFTALAWRRIPSWALKHFAGPALLMFVAASASRVQVGERYILPVYIYLVLLIASAATAIFRERQGAILAAVVLGLHGGPSLMAARDGYLGYFNFLVDRDQAAMVLADSNLDWGQDLPRLAAWQRAHPQTPLQLAYWGMDDPDRYGIVREDLPGSGLYPMHPPKHPFTGVVAISSTYVSGLYPPPGMDGIYRQFLKRTPDDRAGVFMIYKLAP